jgi:hypothetical protein
VEAERDLLLLEGHVGLLHTINFLPHELHFVDLCLD